MKQNDNIINNYDLFVTIVITIVGIGIFAYPRDLTTIVGRDSWIVSLIAGIIIYLLTYLTYKVVKINDFQDLYTILEKNFGNIFGKIIALFFSIYKIFVVSFSIRIFAEVLKMYLLRNTPTEFIIIILILTGMYLIRGDLDNIVKFNEIAFLFMFISLSFVMIFTLKEADFTNMLPIFDNKPLDYIKALNKTLFAFDGFSIAYIIIPYIEKRKKINKVILGSISFVTVFYTIILILCLAVFNKNQTKTLLWPTITMITSIDIPGAFVERWEGVVMALWVIFYFTTFVNLYYFSSYLIKNTFKLGDIKIASFIPMAFVYIISLYPNDIISLYSTYNKIIVIFFPIFFIALPLILIILSKIKNKRGELKNEI